MQVERKPISKASPFRQEEQEREAEYVVEADPSLRCGGSQGGRLKYGSRVGVSKGQGARRKDIWTLSVCRRWNIRRLVTPLWVRDYNLATLPVGTGTLPKLMPQQTRYRIKRLGEY
jgi:hypothetical protein